MTSQAPLPTSPGSAGPSFTYATWKGPEISDNLMNICASLFSENYGIWSPQVPQKNLKGFYKLGFFWKKAYHSLPLFAGKRVKMSGVRLRAQCVSNPMKTVLVTCFKQNQLVGHAFATVWNTSIGKQREFFFNVSSD